MERYGGKQQQLFQTAMFGLAIYYIMSSAACGYFAVLPVLSPYRFNHTRYSFYIYLLIERRTDEGVS